MTVVVPAPEEPVIATMGFFTDMDNSNKIKGIGSRAAPE
jgi:hypothetical protein